MRRVLGFFTRVTAFRIGLVTGLLFVALHILQVAGRADIPLLTKLESTLVDLRFRYRAAPQISGRVVIAAIDESAIARYGRWPWDRRVVAGLVDKLDAAGVAAIGFDMSFSDEDLGAKFAGAKRYRKRFEDISLAAPRNRDSVDQFDSAASDIDGAASAIRQLAKEVKPEGQETYQAARGRLNDGAQKLNESRKRFEELVKRDAEFASELDRDLQGLDPDTILGASIGKASAKTVVGWVALTKGEMTFSKEDLEEQIKRIERVQMHPPEFREPQGDGTERVTPVQRSWIKKYEGLRAPLPVIAKDAKWFGFFNALPDWDGVIRHTALAIQVEGHYFPSLDSALTAVALGVKPQDITPLTANATDGDVIGLDFGGKRTVPTDERGLLEINYFNKGSEFANYSIADLMDGKYDALLKDKVVIVGATAVGTFDQRVTPLSKFTPGVETHANAIETMLSGHFLQRGPVVQGLELLYLVLLALFFALVFSRVRVRYAVPVALLSIAALFGASMLLFSLGYDVIAAMPLVETLAMFVLVIVYRYSTEERDKRQLRKAFQLYLNPEVMEEMLEDPQALQLGGKEVEMSVLFSDIRGFTSISEKLSPQALVHLLNEYLSPMTDIVFEERGTLDKYIGDAVMAFFGAPVQTPDHAANGCDAALKMMETLHRMREKWRIESPDIPNVDIGIGVNSGSMVVGNMGSAQRFNYTVMGDNVNLASRLEGLNKEYGTHILISEHTLQSARKAGRDYGVRELDSVRVKGKKEPVRLFELRSSSPQSSDKPLLEGYAEGLRLYRAQKFAQAQLLFEQFPDDGPSKMMIARCLDMAAAPPGESWDGVFKMEHK